MKNRTLITLACALALMALNLEALAQTTAFNHQGGLLVGGSPASGDHELRLELFDAATGGSSVAEPLTSSEATAYQVENPASLPPASSPSPSKRVEPKVDAAIPAPSPGGPIARPGTGGSLRVPPIAIPPDSIAKVSKALVLRGWVDLHTHPMAHLGFGGMLMVGGTDIGALIPKVNCDRRYVRAATVADVLPNSNATHGGHGVFDNPCGDHLRSAIINNLQDSKAGRTFDDKAVGWDSFAHYPAWNAITHQTMYVDWIRRAVQYGGLRVIVALAVNNKTLGDGVRGPGDPLPTTDKESADLQIDEIKAFAGRHTNLMEIAYSPADLRRIVRSDRLAVVLGIEVDAIGNFHRDGSATPESARAEIDRLWGKGVRYLFPVHVLDNAFGGAAWYEEVFALSNMREFGSYPSVVCANPSQLVTRRFDPSVEAATWIAGFAKLGTAFGRPPESPRCSSGVGHVNTRGMTEVGRQAVIHMMAKGMLIDIDHMSDRTLDCAMQLAEAVRDGYPLISGHNGIRRAGGTHTGENVRHPDQMRRIVALGGMLGLGTEKATPEEWMATYREARRIVPLGRVAIGSDANGLVTLPRPPGGDWSAMYGSSFPRSSMGRKTWDYGRDGVAHYGMFADFLKAVEMRGGKDVVDSLMSSAEQFAQTWEKASSASSRVKSTKFPSCRPTVQVR